MLSFDLVLLQTYRTFDKFAVLCDKSFQMGSWALNDVSQRNSKYMSVLWKNIVFTRIEHLNLIDESSLCFGDLLLLLMQLMAAVVPSFCNGSED